MLHKLQPARMRYLRGALARHFGETRNGKTRDDKTRDGELGGLRVLDVGCGGGLLSESLARLGFEVIGIDASLSSINIARAHAREFMPEHFRAGEQNGLQNGGQNGLQDGLQDSLSPISYQHTTFRDFAKREPPPPRFDLVCAMEIIEHTQDPQEFLDLASQLLRRDGLLLLSTLNRTFESWLKGIIVAEHILGLVPRATHDWQRFITPLELESLSNAAGLRVDDFCGMRYRPLRGDFVLDPSSLSFNYIASASKNV